MYTCEGEHFQSDWESYLASIASHTIADSGLKSSPCLSNHKQIIIIDPHLYYTIYIIKITKYLFIYTFGGGVVVFEMGVALSLVGDLGSVKGRKKKNV